MIAKKFRLTQREVKKVLTRWKPFFAYGIVLNKIANTQWYNRFGIVIGSKSVNTNVSRTFFRRRFYDYISVSKFYNPSPSILLQGLPLKKEEKWKKVFYYDFVFVVKKVTQLDRKNIEAIKSFEKDLNFLIKKVK